MASEVDSPATLVGRGEILAELLAVMTDKHNCGAIIIGEPGVGKTALARTLAGSLGRDMKALHITGGSSLSQVPYGALAPFLQSLSIDDAGSPIAIYRSIMANLGDRKVAGARAPLFIVDDAHELDDSTSALLAQLVAARRAKILLLSRSTPGPPREFLALWHEGLLQRHNLDTLNVEHIHELCTRELGAEVLSNVSAVLAKSTGGNPMFLLALLEHGRNCGYLVQRNGVWLLSGEPPEAGLRLIDLIRNQLRGRSEAEIDVLETVALAEPIPLSILRECSTDEAIDSLHNDSLIDLSAETDAKVTLGHPLYGDVIRAQIPIGRKSDIRRQVLALSANNWDSIEGFLRQVSWGLECGAALDDHTLLRAAIVANRLYNADFALKTARAVQRADLRGRALVETARAQMTQGNLTYARDLVDEVLMGYMDLRLAKEASFLSMDLKMRTGVSTDEIRKDILTWSKAIDRIEREDQDVQPAHLSVARLGCRLLTCFVLNVDGRFAEAETELRSILQEPDCTAEPRLTALTLLGEALGCTDRPVQGATATTEALNIISANGHRYIGHRELVIGRHCLSLQRAGLWERINELMASYSRSAGGGLRYYGGVSELAEGVTALRQGRLQTARKRLVLAVEGFSESDMTQCLPMATGLAAYACAVTGDAARAKSYIESFHVLSRSGTKHMRLLGEVHALAANGLLQGAQQALPQLAGIADQAVAEGMTALALSALEHGAKLGDDGMLGRMEKIAARMEGNEGAVLYAMASAKRSQDPEKLRKAAVKAEDLGYLLTAADCFGLAAKILDDRGEAQKSREAQQRLSMVAQRLEGYESPYFGERHSAEVLTERERSIATLASQGYSNRDIAARVDVSVRTVEGHLYRIFAKLGIGRREELTSARSRFE